MNTSTRIKYSLVPLALCAVVTVAAAQGRGQGQGGEKGKGNQGRAAQADAPKDKPQPRARNEQRSDRGRDEAARAARNADRGSRAATVRRNDDDDDRPARGVEANRGKRATAPNPSARAMERASNNARFKRTWTPSEIRPDLRTRINSNRWAERIAAGALAHAFARDVRDNAFVITPSGQRMLVRNRKGDVLVDLDDDRARNLGAWRVKPFDDRVGEGAPSFCRTGAGHPQWGRQWCLDKGFGLGTETDVRWARNLDISDVVFVTEPTSATLTRAALAAVLGERAVDRLALHAITLGLVDPLVGTWRTDPSGTRVLLVNSGTYPVAEIVDVDRDKRSDRMVVALRPW